MGIYDDPAKLVEQKGESLSRELTRIEDKITDAEILASYFRTISSSSTNAIVDNMRGSENPCVFIEENQVTDKIWEIECNRFVESVYVTTRNNQRYFVIEIGIDPHKVAQDNAPSIKGN
jgi:hypothetical protein